MSRAIYIKSEGNARPLKVTDFEGFTFGELKAHVPEVNFDNSNVIIHSTKTTLFDDSSLIPSEGDVILLVVPQKMKAGYSEIRDVSDNYESMARNEIMSVVREYCDQYGQVAKDYFGNYPHTPTNELIQRIRSYEFKGPLLTRDSNEETQVSNTGEFTELMNDYEELVNATDRFRQSLSAVGNLMVENEENVAIGNSTLGSINKAFREFLNK